MGSYAQCWVSSIKVDWTKGDVEPYIMKLLRQIMNVFPKKLVLYGKTI